MDSEEIADLEGTTLYLLRVISMRHKLNTAAAVSPRVDKEIINDITQKETETTLNNKACQIWHALFN